MVSDSILMKLAAERRKARAKGAGAPTKRRRARKKAPNTAAVESKFMAGLLRHGDRAALEYGANRYEALGTHPAFVRAARAKLARMAHGKGSKAKAPRAKAPKARSATAAAAWVERRTGKPAKRRAPTARPTKGLSSLPDAFLKRIAAAKGPKAPAARAELARRRAR